MRQSVSELVSKWHSEARRISLPQWGKVARVSVTDEVVSDNEPNKRGANGVVE